MTKNPTYPHAPYADQVNYTSYVARIPGTKWARTVQIPNTPPAGWDWCPRCAGIGALDEDEDLCTRCRGWFYVRKP